jgi:hypothetical protein
MAGQRADEGACAGCRASGRASRRRCPEIVAHARRGARHSRRRRFLETAPPLSRAPQLAGGIGLLRPTGSLRRARRAVPSRDSRQLPIGLRPATTEGGDSRLPRSRRSVAAPARARKASRPDFSGTRTRVRPHGNTCSCPKPLGNPALSGRRGRAGIGRSFRLSLTGTIRARIVAICRYFRLSGFRSLVWVPPSTIPHGPAKATSSLAHVDLYTHYETLKLSKEGNIKQTLVFTSEFHFCETQ